MGHPAETGANCIAPGFFDAGTPVMVARERVVTRLASRGGFYGGAGQVLEGFPTRAINAGLPKARLD
jgi:hypothetical protein